MNFLPIRYQALRIKNFLKGSEKKLNSRSDILSNAVEQEEKLVNFIKAIEKLPLKNIYI